MKNLTLGQYYPVASPLHKMDPRAKITVLFLCFILLFMINNPWGFALSGALLLSAMVCSRVPLKIYWRGSRFLLFFIVLASLMNIFFVGGEVLWQYGIFEITKEGLISAGTMIARLVLLILSSYILTFTTTPMELTNAIEQMGAPLQRKGLPIHEIAMIMSIALRFIPTIMQEFEMIKKAQQSRGVDFSGKKIKQWTENMMALVVPLFVNAFHRSEELANAMDARGYTGGEGRTMYKSLTLSIFDIVAMLLMLFVLILVIILRWFL